MKNTKGISYGRVSTDDQFKTAAGAVRLDASPDAQKNRCLAYIDLQNKAGNENLEIIEHISDDGYSGKNTKRPGYSRLVSLIKAKRIGFLVATDISRLNRSVKDFLELINLCEKFGVRLIIIGMSIDTQTAMGKFLSTLCAALAQLEREVTGERVSANTLARLFSHGKINGAGEVLGLVRDKARPGHFVVDESGLSTAIDILKLVAKHSSKKAALCAAKSMGLKDQKGNLISATVINAVLRAAEARYRGYWRVDDNGQYVSSERERNGVSCRRVSLPHGQVIEDAILDAALNRVRDTRQRRSRSSKGDYAYYLSHILKFEDGSGFYGEPAKSGKNRYYFNKANGIRIPCIDLHHIVFSRLRSFVENDRSFQKIASAMNSNQQDMINDLRTQSKGLHSKLQAVQQEAEIIQKDVLQKIRFNEGQNLNLTNLETTFSATLKKMGEEMAQLQGQIDQIKKREEDLKKASFDNLTKSASHLIDQFEHLTGQEKRGLIEQAISQIVIKRDGNHQIHWRILPGSESHNRMKKSSSSSLNGGPSRT